MTNPTPALFKNIADTLINGTFGAFKKPLIVTTNDTRNPDTGVITAGATYNVEAIRTSLSYSESQQYAEAEFALIVENVGLPSLTAVDFSCAFDGAQLSIINASVDGADAAWRLLCRQ